MPKWFILPITSLILFAVPHNVVAPGYRAISTHRVSALVPAPTPMHVLNVPDVPIHLSIPAIHLESSIFPVHLNDREIVDVPDSQVGWYEKGANPGEQGNAVLDGHYIDPYFRTGIFHEMSKLTIGDDILVTDQKSQLFHFRVTNIELVPVSEFPIQHVYGDAAGHGLNLITCAGSYDKKTNGYTHRTIVYSQKVD